MVTNDVVRDRLRQQKLDVILSHRRPRWLGHVHRMAVEVRTPRQAMKLMPNGRRKRGQPRMSWLKNVEI